MAAPVVLLGIPQVHKLAREHDARVLNPVLGATSRLLLLYSLIFSIGWLL